MRYGYAVDLESRPEVAPMVASTQSTKPCDNVCKQNILPIRPLFSCTKPEVNLQVGSIPGKLPTNHFQ